MLESSGVSVDENIEQFYIHTVLTTRAHHKRVAHLLIEGGGEELYHVSQSQEEGGVQVTVVPQHHQQWT